MHLNGLVNLLLKFAGLLVFVPLWASEKNSITSLKTFWLGGIVAGSALGLFWVGY